VHRAVSRPRRGFSPSRYRRASPGFALLLTDAGVFPEDAGVAFGNAFPATITCTIEIDP
jgi:hypothetical protein